MTVVFDAGRTPTPTSPCWRRDLRYVGWVPAATAVTCSPCPPAPAPSSTRPVQPPDCYDTRRPSTAPSAGDVSAFPELHAHPGPRL